MLRLMLFRAPPLKSFASSFRNVSSTPVRCARPRYRTENIPANRVRVKEFESVESKAARYDGYGRLFLGVSCGVGVGGLCFYGLTAPEDSAISRTAVWPAEVRQRLRSTFGYFGAGLAVTAATVAALHRGSAGRRLLQIMQERPVMSMIVPMAGILGASTGIHMSKDRPTKIGFYLVANGLVGALISPLAFLGGPLLLRAAMVTGGALGALSLTAMCAPSKTYLAYSAPVSLALGGLAVTLLGGAFLPATSAAAAGIHSLSIYGGLVLFGAITIYDIQRVVDRAENSYVFDPISGAMSIYMDAINIFIRVAMIMATNQRRR